MLPKGWVCPYLTQSWVKKKQPFLECSVAMFAVPVGWLPAKVVFSIWWFPQKH